jgi:hypothetical protein
MVPSSKPSAYFMAGCMKSCAGGCGRFPQARPGASGGALLATLAEQHAMVKRTPSFKVLNFQNQLCISSDD